MSHSDYTTFNTSETETKFCPCLKKSKIYCWDLLYFLAFSICFYGTFNIYTTAIYTKDNGERIGAITGSVIMTMLLLAISFLIIVNKFYTPDDVVDYY